MTPRRRQASLAAEATNKLIAERALADAEDFDDDEEREDTMSVDSSPLSSLRSGTPTPGSGLNMGLGIQIRRELAGKGDGGPGLKQGPRLPPTIPKPTLVQQVQMLNRKGVNAQGVLMERGTVQPKNRGPGTSGNAQMGRMPTQTNAKENLLLSTALNKNGSRPIGSTQKTSKVNIGLLPLSSPANGGGNMQNTPRGFLPQSSPPLGTVSAQKRPMSAYLESAPDNEQQEREHKRPAQRQWGIPTPSAPDRHPLNNLQPMPPLFQQGKQGPPKSYNDPELLKMSRFIDGKCDVSHFLDAENRRTVEPVFHQVPGFPGLPQYPRPYMAGPEKPTSDQIEEHRLKTMLVKVMGDQKKNMEEMRQTPKPAETFNHQVQSKIDISRLALMKLKPATRKNDPPLFANGTWHSSRRMEDEDALGCSFCMFNCDYGVSDERVWLPAEASGGFCTQCHATTMGSNDSWHLTANANRDRFQHWGPEKRARFSEISDKCAVPPLKELGDDLGFKRQAMEYRNLNERRQVSLGNLGGVPNAQQCQQQVMNAFNGASGGQISLLLPRNAVVSGVDPQQQQHVALPGRTSMIGTGVMNGVNPQQQHQMARSFCQNATGQTSTIETSIVTPQQQQQTVTRTCNNSTADQTAMMGTGATQAMAALVENLGRDRQQFMMQHLNNAGWGHISPTLDRGPLAASPIMNGGATGNNQRRLSNGNVPPVVQTSPHTMAISRGGINNNSQRRFSDGSIPSSPVLPPHSNEHIGVSGNNQRRYSNGSTPSSPALPAQMMANANGATTPHQRMGNPSHGHQRHYSYTGLPQTPNMNGGMTGNNQRSLSDGNMPSSPAFSPQMNSHVKMAPGAQQMGATPIGHQRRSSYTGLPPPFPQTRVNFAGVGRGGDRLTANHHRRTSSDSIPLSSPIMAGGDGFWPVNGPDSSPPTQPFTPNGGLLGNNYQNHHRRTSSGSMPAVSPTLMGGWPLSDLGRSPMMQPFMANGGLPDNNNQQRRLSNGGMMPPSPMTMAYGNGTPNGQQGRAANDPGASLPIQSPTLNGGLSGNDTQRRRLSNGVMQVPSPTMIANQNGMRNEAGSPTMESAVSNDSNQRLRSNSGNRPTQVITLSRSGGVIGPTTLPPIQTVWSAATASSRPEVNTSNLSAPGNGTIAQRRKSNNQQAMQSFDGASDSPPPRNSSNLPSYTNTGSQPRGISSPASANARNNVLGIFNGLQRTGRANFGPPLRNGIAGPTLPSQDNAQRPVHPAGTFPTLSISPETQSSTLTPKNATGPFAPPIPTGFAPSTPGPGSFVPPSHYPASTISDPATSPFPVFQDPTWMTPNLATSPSLPGSDTHAYPHPPALYHANSSPLPNTGSMAPPPRPQPRRSVSQGGTTQVQPQFQPVAFCRGCPWRQIDVKKARICEDCKTQKLEIVKHRHLHFVPLNESRGLDGEGNGIGWGMLANTQRKTCMVCTGLAAYKCQDCSLKVCSDCQVMLQHMCRLFPSCLICGEWFADGVCRQEQYHTAHLALCSKQGACEE
jgi:hypothetical protein